MKTSASRIDEAKAMETIELSTYVDALRIELCRCILMSEGQDLLFSVEKIDLELEIAVEKKVSGEGEAKFKFFVFDANSKLGVNDNTSRKQKLKLSLSPVFRGKLESLMISAETKGKQDS